MGGKYLSYFVKKNIDIVFSDGKLFWQRFEWSLPMEHASCLICQFLRWSNVQAQKIISSHFSVKTIKLPVTSRGNKTYNNLLVFLFSFLSRFRMLIKTWWPKTSLLQHYITTFTGINEATTTWHLFDICKHKMTGDCCIPRLCMIFSSLITF